METQYPAARQAASLAEFSKVWAMGGEANLHLSTSRGLVSVAFSCTIGTPGVSFPSPSSPPPPPPPPSCQHGPPVFPHPAPCLCGRSRHRGPAERERGRQRAALHQEQLGLAPSTPFHSPPPTPLPATEASGPVPLYSTTLSTSATSSSCSTSSTCTTEKRMELQGWMCIAF